MLYFSQTVFKRISLPFTVFIFFLSQNILYSEERHQSAVIMVDRLILRKEPDTRSPSLAILNEGERVIVISHTREWLNVLSGDRKGYIRNRSGYIRWVSEDKNIVAEKKPLAALKERALQIDRRIQFKESKIKELSKQEETLLDQFDSLDFSINQLERKSTALKSQVTFLEKEIIALNTQTDRLNRQLQALQQYVATRLVALYKLNQLGKMHFIFSASSISEFLFIEKSLQQVVTYDDRLQMELLGKRNALTIASAALLQHRERKHLLEAEYAVQLKSMNLEKEKKRGLLKHIREEKEFHLISIKGLQQAADQLEKTIKSFQEQVDSLKVTEEKPTKSFLAMKGLLTIPVQGKIIAGFGLHRDARFQVVTQRNGIEIQTEKGNPVKAVFDGKIIFSDWFRGYGNLIIIDHGESFYTVYAHANERFKEKGSVVNTGEVIATVGDTGFMTGAALYFEIRNHEKPLDPLQWLNLN
jgi:septal ring factor EnvC (AmiA/AmiB activator)